MSYRREIPKLNKDNFQAWKNLMKLHLETIGDTSLKYLEKKYVAPSGTLTVDQIIEKKNHNIMMIDIAPTHNYVEFDEVKDCGTADKKWVKLKDNYGGDDNVRRAKA